MPRCPWCGDDPIYVQYHDTEWGVPVLDDRSLFEKLILDGFQAGLSWITILKKRDNFIRAFDGFQPDLIANYNEEKIQSLMGDAGIVRNQLKIRATVTNAQAYLKITKENSFSDFLWSFVGGEPIINHLKSEVDYVATSRESDEMSKALKELGFKFVGSTICYAFMQAVGMVNDHIVECPRWKELQ
ncbi:MAG: DNA-3-methyladenine glycosylase I [Flavobacteriales bacterium]|nr:DNA-3-methyladenine glycosylase I [Flavobacteriales bacterium]